MTMDFGKAHVGKTFVEVWQADPAWIKWFLTHICQQLESRAPSDDSLHSTDDRRSRGRDVPQPSAKSLPKALGAQPKSLSKPQAATEMPGEPEMDAFEMMSEAPWVAAAESRENIHALQARMLSLETAMQRMLMMMQSATHASEPSRNCSGRVGRSLEQLDDQDDRSHWVLQAVEIDSFCSSSPNKESIHFWDLVNTMENELKTLAKICQPFGPKLDVLEVFCHSDSMLSSQVTQLGGKAVRHGWGQGDLMTTEGRRQLFTVLLKQCPRHVWVSPVCGPWGMWSNFNSLRSLESWDKVREARWDMLSQVALCLVLCGHQHRCQRHAHWEQPKGSLMMLLPYLQELSRYMLVAKPDMRTAGNLQDSVSSMPIKKGLQIHTHTQLPRRYMNL